MKLRFTRRAIAELDEILAYISIRSPMGARRVQRRIQTTLETLLRAPEIGRRTSNKRLRQIAATPYPYLVFYDVTEDEIIIIGVRHGARDPSSMPDT